MLVTVGNSPGQILWVVLVYVIVQIIENYLITPRIQGNAGLWGVIVGVPLVAATRDVFMYFYKQWSVDDSEAPPATEVQDEPYSIPPEDAPLREAQP